MVMEAETAFSSPEKLFLILNRCKKGQVQKRLRQRTGTRTCLMHAKEEFRRKLRQRFSSIQVALEDEAEYMAADAGFSSTQIQETSVLFYARNLVRSKSVCTQHFTC